MTDTITLQCGACGRIRYVPREHDTTLPDNCETIRHGCRDDCDDHANFDNEMLLDGAGRQIDREGNRKK